MARWSRAAGEDLPVEVLGDNFDASSRIARAEDDLFEIPHVGLRRVDARRFHWGATVFSESSRWDPVLRTIWVVM